jgi:hypothetical protein
MRQAVDYVFGHAGPNLVTDRDIETQNQAAEQAGLANRNVLWKDPSRVSEKRKKLLDAVWGDRTWETVAYKTIGHDLFGDEIKVKASNEAIVRAFRNRLNAVAGFAYVPDPIPITNSRSATIYYLFFASPNKTGRSGAHRVRPVCRAVR